MIYLFYILAALLVYTSYLSLRSGIEYLAYFRRELGKPLSDIAPLATVIVPCKGLDQGLSENLAALLALDYPAFETIFVVDDENDPAAAVINDLLAHDHLRNAKLIVAPKAETSSQKTANLREAVRHASADSQIFAFADSDARPSADWLRHLIAPLQDAAIGATTGYRWFISKTPTFASELRSVWNASVASALGPNTSGNFCWGGSMAIRRETFGELNIDRHWKNALSDDFAVTRAVKTSGLAVHFVPMALTPSIENCTLREAFEFTTRQMKITRVYQQKLWVLTFIGSGHYCLVMLAAFFIAIFSRQNSPAVFVSIATIIAVSILSVVKSALRLKAVSLVLTKNGEAVEQQKWPQYTLWALTPFVFFYNCVAALLSKKLTWRGTTYEMISAEETRKLN